jgi:serine/threonine protein kinase
MVGAGNDPTWLGVSCAGAVRGGDGADALLKAEPAQLARAQAAWQQTQTLLRRFHILYPENIIVRRDGYVKIVDFGLAKLTTPHADGAPAPVRGLYKTETHPGVVLGTMRRSRSALPHPVSSSPGPTMSPGA